MDNKSLRAWRRENEYRGTRTSQENPRGRKGISVRNREKKCGYDRLSKSTKEIFGTHGASRQKPNGKEMSNKQKIVTLVSNIISAILGALTGYFGA